MNIIICDDDKYLLDMEKRICEEYMKQGDILSCYLFQRSMKILILFLKRGKRHVTDIIRNIIHQVKRQQL